MTFRNTLVGFVEVKAPGKGADPRRFRDRHDKGQWVKLKSLPNLIYTDGNEFSLWRAGELDGSVVRLIGDVETSGSHLEAPPALLSLFESFIRWEPIPPRDAERQLIADRTRRQATIGIRAKTGQAAPERERRELELSGIQDRELAVGHGLLRFVAYVTVTVTERELLEPAWDELAADAGQHGMALRRCSGWQDAAFACAAIPVGMGLPGRRLPR